MACKKPPQAGRQWLILCETILGLEKIPILVLQLPERLPISLLGRPIST
jgi:hypothetical protein